MFFWLECVPENRIESIQIENKSADTVCIRVRPQQEGTVRVENVGDFPLIRGKLLLKLEKKGLVAFEADAADRRKQRIRLTESCLRFCRANDDRSTALMQQMFAGIPEENLRITIQTIMQMEKQLNELASGENAQPAGPDPKNEQER